MVSTPVPDSPLQRITWPSGVNNFTLSAINKSLGKRPAQNINTGLGPLAPKPSSPYGPGDIASPDQVIGPQPGVGWNGQQNLNSQGLSPTGYTPASYGTSPYSGQSSQYGYSGLSTGSQPFVSGGMMARNYIRSLTAPNRRQDAAQTGYGVAVSPSPTQQQLSGSSPMQKAMYGSVQPSVSNYYGIAQRQPGLSSPGYVPAFLANPGSVPVNTPVRKYSPQTGDYAGYAPGQVGIGKFESDQMGGGLLGALRGV